MTYLLYVPTVYDERSIEPGEHNAHIHKSSLSEVAELLAQGMASEQAWSENPDECVAAPALNCLAIRMNHQIRPSQTFE